MCFRAGPNFGDHAHKAILIVRALNGLRGSGKVWRYHLLDTLRNGLQFKSYFVDQDVWFKQNIKKDGSKYYTFILVYTNDILIVNNNPGTYMNMIKDSYTVKQIVQY